MRLAEGKEETEGRGEQRQAASDKQRLPCCHAGGGNAALVLALMVVLVWSLSGPARMHA
jgi:hypothetical protein